MFRHLSIFFLHVCLCSDLKPANILVTTYLSAKISDFGTSRTMVSAPPCTDVASNIMGKTEEEGQKASISLYGVLVMQNILTCLFSEFSYLLVVVRPSVAKILILSVLLLFCFFFLSRSWTRPCQS